MVEYMKTAFGDMLVSGGDIDRQQLPSPEVSSSEPRTIPSLVTCMCVCDGGGGGGVL